MMSLKISLNVAPLFFIISALVKNKKAL